MSYDYRKFHNDYNARKSIKLKDLKKKLMEIYIDLEKFINYIQSTKYRKNITLNSLITLSCRLPKINLELIDFYKTFKNIKILECRSYPPQDSPENERVLSLEL